MLSYARPDFFAKALQSAVQQTYPNLEIVVVDNRSERSPEIAAVAARYPQVRLIASPTNLGFTGGMNLGIKSSRGEYIFLTEDDLVLDPDCVKEFAARMTPQSPPMLLSGLILNERDGSIWAAGGQVDLAPVFTMTVFGHREPNSGQYTGDFEVNYVSGSMIFASAALFRILGGFREDFFMFSEDVELCFRAAAMQCAIKIIPSARASHFEPKNSPVPKSMQCRKMKNMISLYMLHARPVTVLLFLARGTAAIMFLKSGSDKVLWLRALCSALFAMPRLLQDRYRWRRKCQELSHRRIESPAGAQRATVSRQME